MNKFISDFKAFIMRGNVIDLSVAVIIGGAFGKITTSLVSDIFMPLLGLITGSINLTGLFYALDGNAYATIEAANAAGVGTINYGVFLQNVIDFLIISFCVFCMIRALGKLHRKEPEAPKKAPRLCPYCRMEIADDATRCPHCTSVIEEEKKGA